MKSAPHFECPKGKGEKGERKDNPTAITLGSKVYGHNTTDEDSTEDKQLWSPTLCPIKQVKKHQDPSQLDVKVQCQPHSHHTGPKALKTGNSNE